MIAAHDRNRLIGKGNWMPWHIPNDLSYFKAMTTGKTIVMGRKTLETFKKPLPNRNNIILTRDTAYKVAGAQVFHDYQAILNQFQNTDDEIIIIGGGEIYQLFLPYVDRLYITWIDQSFDGDTYFPEYDLSEWRITKKEKGLKNTDNPYDYYFIQYDRIR
ncbi:dihydrofolate reductase [Amphibacillus sediminis]|uniref:dihydrofolate reductase n=1 Tax=Amphibacillus sediminis TaxID=360185 RepID=UPI00278BFF81|nr:dihydrofolate reductase [Amphibacillus sediminis]